MLIFWESIEEFNLNSKQMRLALQSHLEWPKSTPYVVFFFHWNHAIYQIIEI